MAMVLIQSIIDALASASIITLGGLGLLLVTRSSGVLHFAHGAIFTVAAYSVFVFYNIAEVPFTVAVLLSLLLGAALGLGIEITIYRSLRKRGAGSLVLFIASLGSYIVVENLIALGFGSQIKSFRTWGIETGWQIIGNATLTQIQADALVCASMVVICLIASFRYLRLGIGIRAVWSDPVLAASIGLPLEQLRIVAVLVGSTLAAAAGIFVGCDIDIAPNMGLNPLMLALVAMIIGGNTIRGVVFGAMIVGAAQHLGVLWLPTRWQSLILFAILLTFLIARPQGVFGSGSRSITV